MKSPFLCILGLCPSLLHGEIVINEIYYDAEPNTSCAEFIELLNTGAATVDVSGWRFSKGMDYVFPPGSLIDAGSYFVLAENKAEFDATFGSEAGSEVVAHWSFDEISGTAAADDSGKGLDANASGGIDLSIAGQHGSAVALDGAAGSYLTVPYVEGIHDDSYTMAAWVKPEDNGLNTVFADWSNPWAFILMVNNGVPTFWHRYQATPTVGQTFSLAAPAIPLSQWTHLAVTWDLPSQTARMYVNGVLAITSLVLQPPASLPLLNNNRDYHIGWKKDSTDTFNGALDELWLFKGALTAPSILELKNNNTVLSTRIIDLADIIGGGDGSLPGTGTASGVNAANGVTNAGGEGGDFNPASPGLYSNVSYPFIDGVFVPDGSLGTPQKISSTNLTYNFTGTGNNNASYANWFNGVGAITDPSGQNNLPLFSSSGETHSMISAHAQKGITFDLNAIEAANENRQIASFTCIAGDSRPKAGGVISYFVLVDGIVKTSGLNLSNAEQAVEISIAPGDRFLSLVITNADNTNNSDHGYFGNAFLHIVAPPAAATVTAFGQYTGDLAGSGENVELINGSGLVMDSVSYAAEFPWPVNANGGGVSMELVNPALDSDLAGSWRSATIRPTPGAENSAFLTNAPPQMRQVAHTPKQPLTTEAATISVKVTDSDGVQSVSMQYQLVAPGAYVPAYLAHSTATLLASPTLPNLPNPAYAQNWQTVAMTDDGTGTNTYKATITAQPSRTLVRYRIIATDTLGANVRIPYPDDPSLNFAYFSYDGVPDFVAGTRSVTGTVPFTHPKETLTKVPVYHLVTAPADFTQCVAYSGADQIPGNNFDARSAYNWTATFVYNGNVYDNVSYRLRQRNARYSGAGKRSFRFRFNKGNYVQFHDLDGNPYPEKWRTLNSHKGNALGGTNWGLYEAANNRLWNLTGTPAPATNWFHLRVVDQADEAPGGTNGQNLGDFYGLMLGIEDYDVRFLQSHNLDKGNLYKLKSYKTNGKEVQRYQAKEAVTDASDFGNIIFNLRPAQTDQWLLSHVDYEAWYRYHAIVDAVRHYDVQPNTGEHLKNRSYYFRPDIAQPLGKLVVLPWDSDTSWGPNYNGGVDFCKDAMGTRPDFVRDYKNAVREIHDLIWQEDQIALLLDAYQTKLADVALADRDRWTNSPAAAGTQNDEPLENRVADMKKFAFIGGSWTGGTNALMDAASNDNNVSGQQGRDAYLDVLAGDAAIPNTPTIFYTGTAGYPANDLRLQANAFSDPQGAGTGTSMEFRVAEISTVGSPGPLKFEWKSDWESGEIPPSTADVTVPASALRTGSTYRARVRHLDNTGRWSHWSTPLEFVVSAPDISILTANLVITEMMYHPSDATPTEIAAGFQTSDFEWIELHNVSTTITLDLTDVRFTKGIDSDIPSGTTLPPGGYALVVADPAAFAFRYGSGLPVIASFPNDNLKNGGERLKLSYGTGNAIREFEYFDTVPWPTGAQGSGKSIVLIAPATVPDHANGNNWRNSDTITPGAAGGLLSYTVWAAANLPAGPSADAGADFDSDGFSNFYEFAFAADAASPASIPTLSPVVLDIAGQDYLTASFTVRTDHNVIYTAQSSTGLNAWLNDAVILSQTDNLDGTRTITIRAPLPLSGETKVFLRVEASE